jgi:hypothetical protein
MELQYQVGRLELENMELEQHRIVHESILKGKDLVVQKLRLQLAVRDKLIQRQQTVLAQHHLDLDVGYSQFALLEQTLVGEVYTFIFVICTYICALLYVHTCIILEYIRTAICIYVECTIYTYNLCICIG